MTRCRPTAAAIVTTTWKVTASPLTRNLSHTAAARPAIHADTSTARGKARVRRYAQVRMLRPNTETLSYHPPIKPVRTTLGEIADRAAGPCSTSRSTGHVKRLFGLRSSTFNAQRGSFQIRPHEEKLSRWTPLGSYTPTEGERNRDCSRTVTNREAAMASGTPSDEGGRVTAALRAPSSDAPPCRNHDNMQGVSEACEQ